MVHGTAVRTTTIAGALLSLAVLASGCSGGSGAPAVSGTPASIAASPVATTGQASTSAGASVPASAAAAPGLPRAPAHTVVVVMENHAFDSVVGSSHAPWVNSLDAAVLTDWHGVAHPSQPNYIALFSGSTQGVTSDHCPVQFDAPTLASQLRGAGLTFTGYSEDLPGVGATDCTAGRYARKHNPWVDSSGLPAEVNQPLSALPTDFSTLPTVSIVVPNLCHDTHDCHREEGDAWLKATFEGYVTWARDHDSLLVITYDEDDDSPENHIPTFLVGPMVTPGRYDVRGDHYTMLRTLEALYGLPGLGEAAGRAPLAALWRTAG